MLVKFTGIERRVVSLVSPVIVLHLFAGAAFAGHIVAPIMAARPALAGQTGGDAIRLQTAGQTGGDAIILQTAGQTGGDAIRLQTAGQTGGDAVRLQTAGQTGGDAVRLQTAGQTGGDAVRYVISGPQGEFSWHVIQQSPIDGESFGGVSQRDSSLP